MFVFLVLAVVAAGEKVCRWQKNTRSGENLYNVLRHDLQLGEGEVLSLRGRNIKTSNSAKNGIKLSFNSTSTPLLKIFANEPISGKGPTKIPTVIRVLNEDQTSYSKVIFAETTYSLDSDVVYQISVDDLEYTIRINGAVIKVERPMYQSTEYNAIQHVSQMGQATVFKEISRCPRSMRTSILHHDHLRAKDCISSACREASIRTAFIGDMVALNCLASGLPPIRIWWTHNGAEIEESETFILTESSYSTQTIMSSRVVFQLEEEGEGWYSCKAQNMFESSISSTSYIDVAGFVPLTTTILDPKYVIAGAGESVVFTCLVYQWPMRAGSVSWRALDGSNTPLVTSSSREVDHHVSATLKV